MNIRSIQMHPSVVVRSETNQRENSEDSVQILSLRGALHNREMI